MIFFYWFSLLLRNHISKKLDFTRSGSLDVDWSKPLFWTQGRCEAGLCRSEGLNGVKYFRQRAGQQVLVRSGVKLRLTCQSSGWRRERMQREGASLRARRTEQWNQTITTWFIWKMFPKLETRLMVHQATLDIWVSSEGSWGRRSTKSSGALKIGETESKKLNN